MSRMRVPTSLTGVVHEPMISWASCLSMRAAVRADDVRSRPADARLVAQLQHDLVARRRRGRLTAGRARSSPAWARSPRSPLFEHLDDFLDVSTSKYRRRTRGRTRHCPCLAASCLRFQRREAPPGEVRGRGVAVDAEHLLAHGAQRPPATPSWPAAPRGSSPSHHVVCDTNWSRNGMSSALSFARAWLLSSAMFTPCGQARVQTPHPSSSPPSLDRCRRPRGTARPAGRRTSVRRTWA